MPLTRARYLKAEQCFDRIVVFEQRDDVGGVWNYTPAVPTEHQSDLSIPRTRPSDEVENPWSGPSTSGAARCIFPSPIYDSLETNIPHTLMNFSDRQFPQGCPLFPPFQIVKSYLKEYAADIEHHMRLQTQVHRVESTFNRNGSGSAGWSISYTELGTGLSYKDDFDAVVCATGHYSDPFVPDIQGIRGFQDCYPGIISHSKYYKNPTEYAQKVSLGSSIIHIWRRKTETPQKVMIVGNSASGVDISRLISGVAAEVLVSEKEKPAGLRTNSNHIKYVPEICEFVAEGRTVRFLDGSTESGIDNVIFCTGYQYSFPFLGTLNPAVVTTGSRTHNTYQHMFYHSQPTLAFLTLPQRIVPFPVAEAQAAYVARVFSGRLRLPGFNVMNMWETERLKNKGEKYFHDLGFPDDASYINMLYSMSMSASGGPGKIPPFWNDEKIWIRQQFPMIKQAALRLGSKRSEVRSLADLGFDYGTKSLGFL